jgi:hypothetical protein
MQNFSKIFELTSAAAAATLVNDDNRVFIT